MITKRITQGGLKSLKQMRLEAQQAGLTNTVRLAQTLGVDKATILKWEKDEDSISLGDYKKWQLACGVNEEPRSALTVTRVVRIRKAAGL
jgi:DNA-binding XRE family transcriptional regulator